MSSTSSNLPPLPDGVFSPSASALIDAPIEDVWNIILDFPSYKEWNPFARNQTITDSHKTPLSDQTTTPRPGQYLYIYPVHLPPTLSEPAFPAFLHTSSAFTQITTVDHANYRAAWRLAGPLPSFLLASHRWQVLSVDETGKTRYETVEVFEGVVAYLVKWFVGGLVEQGFKAQADALKTRAERLRKAT